ncbi:hypothetical protein [Archangium sp.]|uniref:hypothetical protein n=1 Tax=Archangium sp. TaxID=1872627 RepID=UPI002EDABAD8
MDPALTQDYLNALQAASISFWQNQSTRWLGMLQRMREGTYDASQFAQDAVFMWDNWVSLAAFPVQFGVSQTRQLPTLLFVVDGIAENSGPATAPTPIFVPSGVTIELTDLYRVGGNATIAAKDFIRVTLSQTGDRMELTLIDIDKGKFQPGLYVGAVYAPELAARRPLAVVHIFIAKPPGEPPVGP